MTATWRHAALLAAKYRLQDPAVCMVCGTTAQPDTAHLQMTNIYTPGGGGSWWVCRDADGCRARAGDLERAL